MSWDRQRASAPHFGLIGRRPGQFWRNDPRRIDANQHFSLTRTWLWCVFIDEPIWAATAMNTDRFHFVVSLLSFRQVCNDATKLAQISHYTLSRAQLSVLFWRELVSPVPTSWSQASM